MEDDFRGIRFSFNQNVGQIDTNGDYKREDNQRSFKEMELGRFFIVTLILSIGTFVLDLFLHCWLAHVYYAEGETTFFALTIFFLVMPALVSSAFSMRWYLQDEDEPSMKRQPLWKWGLRVIMLVLQLAPLLRYYDTFAYGILSYIHKRRRNLLNQQKYLRMMLDEETNACLLRLLTCFLMSAPQAIIQLVFLWLHTGRERADNAQVDVGGPPWTVESSNDGLLPVPLSGCQPWAIACSIVSVSWALTAYHRSVRLAREDKEKLSVISAILMFCWNLFSAMSRILALSLLAALYPSWFATICFAHWLIMSLWIDIVHHQSGICASRCEEIIFNLSLGLAYVIAFISPKDGPTRYSYLAYYLVCFIENTAALVVWCVAGKTEMNGYLLQYGIIIFQISSFLLCIFFIVSYYRCYHPSGTTAIITKTVQITESPNRDEILKLIGAPDVVPAENRQNTPVDPERSWT